MFRRILLSCLILLMAAPVASAIVLEAVTDVWIRESGPDTTFENDLMSVWNSFGNDAGTRRYGVVQFDVSGLNGTDITEAYFGLWGGAHGFSDQNKAIKQTSVFIDTSGGTPASAMTWNVFQNEYAASGATFESFGAFDLAAPTESRTILLQ